jgi:glyoxylase-like metal-dependent hydrolase (beta-lactamase superfamily II)
MKIIPLSEGLFTIDATKIFVPFNPDKENLQSRPKGSLLVEIQPFVIVTASDIILIDAGLGFTINGSLQIYNNLQQHGISPNQITKVLVSHLHKDHSGALGIRNQFNQIEHSFTNAMYYIQKQEFELAMQKKSSSYIIEDISFLEHSNQVEWLTGSGNITSNIQCEITSAHSPFHQVFWIKENDEILFFGGDDAPQLQQMKNRFVAKYDFNGKKAMQLRQQWYEEGKKENWTFLFYHDIKSPYYKFQ